jgi:hypothetical protein
LLPDTPSLPHQRPRAQKDEFLRPDIGDGVPSEPRLYTPVPWEHIAFKELLKGEEDEHMVSAHRLGGGLCVCVWCCACACACACV